MIIFNLDLFTGSVGFKDRAHVTKGKETDYTLLGVDPAAAWGCDDYGCCIMGVCWK